MAKWIRFEQQGKVGFGTLEGDSISVYEGDMFKNPRATGKTVAKKDVKVLTPTEAQKYICLWNNYGQLAQKINQTKPEDILWLIKSPNAYLADGETIRQPKAYSGKVVFEGEIGVVIGKEISNVDEAGARDAIFGYTIINDVTAAEITNKDPSFAQWTRAKGYDTFGVFGPVIDTEVDPTKCTVKTLLTPPNGEVQERQNYPVSDAFYSPVEIVAKLSNDVTLYPGDIIAIGTNVGVGSMKSGSTVQIVIDGIGTLTNRFE